jgi:hypothetical protein
MSRIFCLGQFHWRVDRFPTDHLISIRNRTTHSLSLYHVFNESVDMEKRVPGWEEETGKINKKKGNENPPLLYCTYPRQQLTKNNLT